MCLFGIERQVLSYNMLKEIFNVQKYCTYVYDMYLPAVLEDSEKLTLE